MPKYYIHSGDLKTVIDRPTQKQAVVDAFLRDAADAERLGIITLVSETGFEGDKDDDVFYPTERLLGEVGLLEQFMPDPSCEDIDG